jgi:hypothetical protein
VADFVTSAGRNGTTRLEAQEDLYEIILAEFADLADDEVVDLQKIAPRLLVGRTAITMGELRRSIRSLRTPKPGPPQPPMGRSRRHA